MSNMDGPDAPFPGMATAFEAHTGQSWTDPNWRGETAMWAAAWKAAKLDRKDRKEDSVSLPQGFEVVAENVVPSSDPGAWTCRACGFRGFWSGGPHCMQTHGIRNAPPNAELMGGASRRPD